MTLQQETKGLWVVAYVFNGQYREKEFEFRTEAELEVIKLEAYSFKPTIHFK